MLVIGLTGGIASGKSAAAKRFAELGIDVVDADRISHDLVAPGCPALEEITATFGQNLLLPDGSLDRAALGAKVFADPQARQQLEAILHPLVRREMQRQLADVQSPYAILMAPLLLESGMTDLVDRLLVIDAPEALQRQRCLARDQHSEERIDQILAAQTDRETRLAAADDVVLNDRGLQALHQAVDALHQRYLQLANLA